VVAVVWRRNHKPHIEEKWSRGKHYNEKYHSRPLLQSCVKGWKTEGLTKWGNMLWGIEGWVRRPPPLRGHKAFVTRSWHMYWDLISPIEGESRGVVTPRQN
jgi:hypothetical protein